jgi:hypothetical protein
VFDKDGNGYISAAEVPALPRHNARGGARRLLARARLLPQCRGRASRRRTQGAARRALRAALRSAGMAGAHSAQSHSPNVGGPDPAPLRPLLRSCAT